MTAFAEPEFYFICDGAPQFRGEDEAVIGDTGCTIRVANQALTLASLVATRGLGEKKLAGGFLMILGDKVKLLSGTFGTLPERSMFRGQGLTIGKVLTNAADLTFALPTFGKDKALVLCGKTGEFLSDGFTVTALGKGDTSKGTKFQAASSIGQEGFCAIKCSEDSCSCDGNPIGDFDLFFGSREVIHVPVKQVRQRVMHSRVQLTVQPRADN